MNYRLSCRSFEAVRKGAVLVTLGLLLVYLATAKGSESGDTLPNRYLPVSLLTGQGFTLDRLDWLRAPGSPFYNPDDPAGAYFLRLEKGHYVSAYPVLPALLALPVYVPFALAGVPLQSPLWGGLEKLAGALLVALSGGLLYLTLRRVAGPQMALLATAVYGLGTSNLSVCSQGLWQHGAGQLFLTAVLYCLVRGERWVGCSGVFMALTVVNRPLDVLLVGPLFLYVAVSHRDRLLQCVLWGLPVVLLQFSYNACYLTGPFDFPLGEVLKKKWPSGGGFSVPISWGIYRQLLSPGRGLWIYSPILILALPGFLLAWRPQGDRLLRWAGLGVLALLAVTGKWMGWWGGHTFGPRLLSDLSPLLAFALYPLEGWLAGPAWRRALVGACLAWSVLVHSLGAFTLDTWSADVDVNYQPDALWSWTNNQWINPLRRVKDAALVAWTDPPTSRTEDDSIDSTRLAVQYRGGVWPKTPLRPGQRLTLGLRVTNESRAVWLTGGPLRGRVRLAWRWFLAGQQVAPEGRANLARDLFPGDSYDLRISFPVPREPGLYGLEVGLIREGITWYPSPTRFLVTVAGD